MKTRFASIMLLCALWAATARAEPLPADLAAVPADSLGFVHVRIADIWKSEAFKEFRETVLKAGDKALDGFDKRFLPSPSSIDRLTVAFVQTDEMFKEEPKVVFIVGFNKPYDADGVLKSMMPKGEMKKAKQGAFHVDEKKTWAMSFLGKQAILFGPADAIEFYLNRPAKSEGALASALQEAAAGPHIYLAGNLSLIPAKVRQEAPPEAKDLLTANLVTLGIQFSDQVTLDLKAHFPNKQAADDAAGTINKLATQGRTEMKKFRDEMLAKVLGDGKVTPLEQLPEAAMALVLLGSLERLDEILANPPIKRQGDTLAASVKLPINPQMISMMAMSTGMLLPAVQKVREAASKSASMANLNQLGKVMHMYNNDFDMVPAPVCDKNGKPLLSWRVAVLPYIEQTNLYNQFKRDEPWDSENNKKLIPLMPKVYSNKQAPMTEPGMTYYRIFQGKDVVFQLSPNQRSIQAIPDGSSNTGFIFEAFEPTIWTKPEEFTYDAKKPLPKFGAWNGKTFLVLFGDGSVRSVPVDAPEKALRDTFTAADGNVVDLNPLPPRK